MKFNHTGNFDYIERTIMMKNEGLLEEVDHV